MCRNVNEYIRCFHEYQIPNLQIFSKNIFFYDLQLSKLGQKAWFGPMRNLFSSSTVLTEYTSWKKLVNQVGESI